MKLLYKRIFIFFSVALNIGFIIMALFMVVNHPGKSTVKSGIEGLIQKLDLTETQHDDLLKSIQSLRVSVEKQEMEIKAARDNLIRVASENGPLDRRRLNELCEAIDQEETDKNRLMLTHMIEIRDLLGDEKGARFFSLLLEHLKNRHNPNRR